MSLNLLYDIKHANQHQLYVKYNIIVNADGSVYDNTQKSKFNNLTEWSDLFTKTHNTTIY